MPVLSTRLYHLPSHSTVSAAFHLIPCSVSPTRVLPDRAPLFSIQLPRPSPAVLHVLLEPRSHGSSTHINHHLLSSINPPALPFHWRAFRVGLLLPPSYSSPARGRSLFLTALLFQFARLLLLALFVVLVDSTSTCPAHQPHHVRTVLPSSTPAFLCGVLISQHFSLIPHVPIAITKVRLSTNILT